jgi:hypothetical protein
MPPQIFQASHNQLGITLTCELTILGKSHRQGALTEMDPFD